MWLFKHDLMLYYVDIGDFTQHILGNEKGKAIVYKPSKILPNVPVCLLKTTTCKKNNISSVKGQN